MREVLHPESVDIVHEVLTVRPVGQRRGRGRDRIRQHVRAHAHIPDLVTTVTKSEGIGRIGQGPRRDHTRQIPRQLKTLQQKCQRKASKLRVVPLRTELNGARFLDRDRIRPLNTAAETTVPRIVIVGVAQQIETDRAELVLVLDPERDIVARSTKDHWIAMGKRRRSTKGTLSRL